MPLSFLPAIAPSGSVAPDSDVVAAGIPVTTQWVNTLFGASGSSTTIAMLLVSAGGVDHDSGGVCSLPSHVYSVAIVPFDWIASDLRINCAGFLITCFGALASAAPAPATINEVTTYVSLRMAILLRRTCAFRIPVA